MCLPVVSCRAFEYVHIYIFMSSRVGAMETVVPHTSEARGVATAAEHTTIADGITLLGCLASLRFYVNGEITAAQSLPSLEYLFTYFPSSGQNFQPQTI